GTSTADGDARRARSSRKLLSGWTGVQVAVVRPWFRGDPDAGRPHQLGWNTGYVLGETELLPSCRRRLTGKNPRHSHGDLGESALPSSACDGVAGQASRRGG